MDRLIYLFGALLMSGGIVVLLGITPEVMTQDIMSLLSRQRSLKYLVAKARGKVRRSRLQQAVMNVRNALTATICCGAWLGASQQYGRSVRLRRLHGKTS